MPFLAQSSWTYICPGCELGIQVGEETRPIEGQQRTTTSGKSPALQWAHALCVAVDDPRVPVCKHWKKRGSCLFKERCQFRHPDNEAHSNSVQRAPVARHGVRKHRRVYNEGRCGALRRWMVRVFGEEYLRSGSGVLDIAGGKGEMAFELTNLNGIPCSVVDPRPMDLYRYKRKLLFGYYHRNEVLGEYNSVPRPLSDEDICLPGHIRAYFEMTGVGSRYCLDTTHISDPVFLYSDDIWASELERGKRTCWTNKGLVHEEEEGEEEEDEEGEKEVSSPLLTSEYQFEPSSLLQSRKVLYGAAYKHHDYAEGRHILSLDEARDAVCGCSIIIGMHPDQAAEQLIEFALRNNKPFAVVPCCVYQKQFPKRYFQEKRPVRVYGELVEYLLEKHPAIRALEMDFDGKNVLLYYLAGIDPLVNPEEPIENISKGAATAAIWWRLSKQQKTFEAASLSVSEQSEVIGCTL